MKKSVLFLLVALFALVAFAAEEVTVEEPVLITSGGQSPGALQMMVLAKGAKIDYVFEKNVTADYETLGDFNTIIIVAGASSKGLGAAGIDIDTEIERLTALVAAAKEKGLKIVLAQIEGATRRGSSSDLVIDVLIDSCDLMLIKEDADNDGKFTALSEEHNIKMLTFSKTSDARGLLTELFGH
ncbi:MAG TPA: DUF6305 family protein [Thermotogota bacterium]|nr:DUF6305 family protein [Thermotogota bacterium]HPJ88467.1 DUF6305 family protein [Thermotogota bacterium]HPR96494.1 DUF6305 family protein [Thermotogota bacterium]